MVQYSMERTFKTQKEEERKYEKSVTTDERRLAARTGRASKERKRKKANVLDEGKGRQKAKGEQEKRKGKNGKRKKHKGMKKGGQGKTREKRVPSFSSLLVGFL